MLTSSPKKKVRGDRDRSWMSDDYFDLIVWYYPDGSIYGFQLCYGKPRWERALTWTEAEGFAHTEIDTGEDQATRNRTPILVAGDSFPVAEVRAEFRRRSTALPVPLRRLVERRISQFARRPFRGTLRCLGFAAAAVAGVVIVGRLWDRVTVGAVA